MYFKFTSKESFYSAKSKARPSQIVYILIILVLSLSISNSEFDLYILSIIIMYFYYVNMGLKKIRADHETGNVIVLVWFRICFVLNVGTNGTFDFHVILYEGNMSKVKQIIEWSQTKIKQMLITSLMHLTAKHNII